MISTISVPPQVQPYSFTELDAFDDRDLGAIFTRDNGTTVSFSVDVIADPCPDIEWTFNGMSLNTSETITFNNPCIEEPRRSSNWTFSLNVTITEETSGSYSAKLNNTAGTTQLPKVYFTIPGMFCIHCQTRVTCSNIFRACLHY